jgi:hypothetical protein
MPGTNKDGLVSSLRCKRGPYGQEVRFRLPGTIFTKETYHDRRFSRFVCHRVHEYLFTIGNTDCGIGTVYAQSLDTFS